MVARGRDILERAFGKEGWQRRAGAMRVEQARWRSLSAEERDNEAAAEALAYDQDISIEEARQRIRSDPTLVENLAQLDVQGDRPYADLPEAVEQIKRR